MYWPSSPAIYRRTRHHPTTNPCRGTHKFGFWLSIPLLGIGLGDRGLPFLHCYCCSVCKTRAYSCVSIFCKRGAGGAALRSNPVTIICQLVLQEKRAHCDEVKGKCFFFVVLLLAVPLQAVGCKNDQRCSDLANLANKFKNN